MFTEKNRVWEVFFEAANRSNVTRVLTVSQLVSITLTPPSSDSGAYKQTLNVAGCHFDSQNKLDLLMFITLCVCELGLRTELTQPCAGWTGTG